ALQRFCYVNSVPGCLLRDLQEQAPPPAYANVPYSWQSSIGIARQFADDMAIEVDYVNTKSRHEKSIQDNVNVTFNPDTGIPYPYSIASRRAFPLYGVVGMFPMTGMSDYHGLQTRLTKRMSHRRPGTLTSPLSRSR